MRGVMRRVWEILGGERFSRCGSDYYLDAAMEAARIMSSVDTHRDTVIVVVELGSDFDVESGGCLKRQYLYYPFREQVDFRRIVCLRAAYRNGVRIDKDAQQFDPEDDARKVLKDLCDRSGTPAIVWGKPGRWTNKNLKSASANRS
jgi:hypothetical protein